MNYDWLPPMLAEIAEVAGLDAALALAAARGGSRITIPARVRPDHWLTKAVGSEAAALICDHFRVGNSGAVIELPVGTLVQKQRRIDAMIGQGVSADQIAARLGVHRTMVFRRKARVADDPRQSRLFD